MIIQDENIKKKILDYYKDYYRNLGIPGFERNVNARLNEDEWELRRLRNLEKSLTCRMTDFNRHLIVGLGTGGLAVALKGLGVSEIYGIEPNGIALDIARCKGILLGLPESSFKEAVAEKLPYPDKYFDFIHCFSVIEHVKDVRHSIKEMYRVLDQKGMIHIHTTNYSWPYEGHYKIPAPVFLPGGKMITRLWLKILGRPTKYLESIQFVTEKNLDRILKEEVALFFRIFSKDLLMRRMPKSNGVKSRLKKWIFHLFDHTLDIYPYQEIIIKKI